MGIRAKTILLIFCLFLYSYTTVTVAQCPSNPVNYSATNASNIIYINCNPINISKFTAYNLTKIYNRTVSNSSLTVEVNNTNIYLHQQNGRPFKISTPLIGATNSNTTTAPTSLVWSGYVVASNFTKPESVVTEIDGSWLVQKVPNTKRNYTSTQWAGIGAWNEFENQSFNNDLSLIQAGTESDSGGGTQNYYAWVEALPSPQVVIRNLSTLHPAPVRPGDKIITRINLVTSIPEVWQITVIDLSENWYSIGAIPYISSERSGEFIDERPRDCLSFCILNLTDFNTSYYGYDYSGLSYSDQITMNGTTKPIGYLPNQNIVMVTSNGTVLAVPSAITSDATSFTVKYGNLITPIITASNTILKKGQQLTLTATEIGGTNQTNLTYKWYTVSSNGTLSAAHGNVTNNTFTPSRNLKGAVTYVVSVNDTGLYPNAQAQAFSQPFTVVISSQNLPQPSISPSSPIIDAGQELNLKATINATANNGIISWQWYKLDNNSLVNTQNAAGNFILVSPNATASYEVSATSSKTGAVSFSAPDNVIVYPAFSTPSIMPISPTITRGQSIILNALETGGTGTFSYQWYTAENGIATAINNSTSASITVSPNKTTSYEVKITDIGTNANATPTESASSLPVTVTVISQEPTVILPSNVIYYVPVTITNNALISPTDYQLAIPFNYNNKTYSTYENATLSFQNVKWFYINGTVIPSWVADGGATTWLYLGNSLKASSNLTVYAGFESNTVNILNATGNEGCEADNCGSVPYGLYDNGNTIFPFYDNFAGTQLNFDNWQCPHDPTCANEVVVHNSVQIYNKSDCFYPPGLNTPARVCGQSYLTANPSKDFVFTSPFDLTIIGGMQMDPWAMFYSDERLGYWNLSFDGYKYVHPAYVFQCYSSFYFCHDHLVQGSNTMDGNVTNGYTTIYDNSQNGHVDESMMQASYSNNHDYLVRVMNNTFSPIHSPLSYSSFNMTGALEGGWGWASGREAGSSVNITTIFVHTPDPIEGHPPYITTGAVGSRCSASSNLPSGSPLAYICINVTNFQSTTIQAGTPINITIDGSSLSSTFNQTNAQNADFHFSNGTPITSWLEGCTNNENSSANLGSCSRLMYWISLPYSIPGKNSTQIYMYFYNKSANKFNKSKAGIAPQLFCARDCAATTYAEFDNGNMVFPFYDNFIGTALNSQWTASCNVSVNNGITIPCYHLESVRTFQNPNTTFEWLGHISADGNIGVRDFTQGNSYYIEKGDPGSGCPTAYSIFAYVYGGAHWLCSSIYDSSNRTFTNVYMNEAGLQYTINYSNHYSTYGSFTSQNSHIDIYGGDVYIQWFRARSAFPDGVAPSIFFSGLQEI